MRTFQADTLYSMFAPDALIQVLETAYGFTPGDLSCQLIKATMRDTYDIRSHRQDAGYIFQIYRHNARTRQTIEAELRCIQHLHDSGVSVARLQMTVDDDALILLDAPEGQRFGVLFHAIEGQAAGRSLTPDEASACGRSLAAFHAAESPENLTRPVIDSDVLLTESLQQIAAARPDDDALLAFLHDCADKLRPQLADLPRNAPAYGLIHGDVIPSNVLITPQDDAVLIDFDLCGYGWRGYDIASFLMEIDYWRMGDTVKQAFIESYRAESPVALPDAQTIALFQSARLIFSLGVPAAHIQTWGRNSFSEGIINRHVTMLKERMSA
jgi:Ser/Thr protein kinase RdoA (MazF antagonist)